MKRRNNMQRMSIVEDKITWGEWWTNNTRKKWFTFAHFPKIDCFLEAEDISQELEPYYPVNKRKVKELSSFKYSSFGKRKFI